VTPEAGAGEAGSVAASLARLQRRADGLERTLRLQSNGELPEALTVALAAIQGDPLDAAVARVVALTVAYREWAARRTGERSRDDAASETAMVQLIAREPVPRRLTTGRVIYVTGRSAAALLQLSAHEARLELLRRQFADVRHEYGRTLLLWDRTPAPWRRERWWRRAETLHAAYHELHVAILRHRERLWAHAMTPTGAAARLDEEAPAWWRETTAVDDAGLVEACWEAGPGRIAAASQGTGERESGEVLSFARILGVYGRALRTTPAALMSEDFGMLWASVESLPQLDDLQEETEGAGG
jgi:hypothetical protein